MSKMFLALLTSVILIFALSVGIVAMAPYIAIILVLCIVYLLFTEEDNNKED